VRRWLSSGKFRADAPLADVPLFEAALAKHRRAPSEPHRKGWRTRRAPVLATMAELRAELGL